MHILTLFFLLLNCLIEEKHNTMVRTKNPQVVLLLQVNVSLHIVFVLLTNYLYISIKFLFCFYFVWYYYGIEPQFCNQAVGDLSKILLF